MQDADIIYKIILIWEQLFEKITNLYGVLHIYGKLKVSLTS